MTQDFDPIRAVEDIDAAWLTDVLHAAGIGLGAEVASFDATSIGTGQVGENVRFVLAWSAGSAESGELPASVVGKFPSTSDVSRATAQQLDTYTREIGFYRDVQHRVTISSPLVHHIGWDPATHDFAILMGDITPASQGDQLIGCSAAEAELAIDEAVGLHAPLWGRTSELASLEWLAMPDPNSVTQRAGLFDMLMPGFLERFAQRLTAADLELAQQLVGAMVRWAGEVASWAEQHDAWCIVHGDYRLDNMLFGESPAAPLTVVDWQTAAIGIGPSDIAYFCGAGLLPDLRVQHERRLVERYAAGMRRAGVSLTDDDAWDGYVLGSVSGLYMAIVASQVVEQTERGDEMFAVMAERHAAQIRATGLLGRLGLSQPSA